MLAVEFETQARNGMIKIPEEYRQLADGDLKIIILKHDKKPEPEISNQWKNFHMKNLLMQIREKGIFQTIDDPVEWQRTIRDEWA